MTTGNVCPALLVSIGVLLGAVPATAEDCPAGTPSPATHRVAIAPEAPRFGSRVDVSIQLKAGEQLDVKAICFDSHPAVPENVVIGTGSLKFAFTIPAPDSQRSEALVPYGDHELTLVADVPSVPAAPGQPPTRTIFRERFSVPRLVRLDSIDSKPLRSAADTFKVILRGDGFDLEHKDNNEIRLDDDPLDICWDDADCNLKHSTIRGNVESAQRITLEHINPAEERAKAFRVCRFGKCTESRQDEGATTIHVFTALGAGLATALIVGLVLVLVYKYLRPEVIEGESYIVRALFIDKETNTYSLSKLQFYLWTLAAVYGYVYLTLARNLVQYAFGLPPLPSGLPGIVAIAGGTAIGAQVVTNMNGPKGAGLAKPTLADFVSTGDVVAADRVQFFVWTVIGATGFLVVIAHLDPRTLVELPSVPESLLMISGVSAFGYLGGKLARDPGPVVAEVTISVGPDPAAAAAQPGQPPAPPGPAGPFGILEIRGRTISADANFKISTGEESAPDDVELSFDKLVPAPADEQKIKKPRIIEQDADSKDKSMAKRLMLVVNLDDKSRPIFTTQKKQHTLIIANPDSQRVAFKFTVPETQKPA